MKYRLYVPWRQRKETAWHCAMRLSAMLEGLAAAHRDLARWNKQAETRAAADEPLFRYPPVLPDLEALFESGKFFKSGSGELCPKLGYSIGAWNGLDSPRSMSLSVRAGAYTDRNSQPNSV